MASSTIAPLSTAVLLKSLHSHQRLHKPVKWIPLSTLYNSPRVRCSVPIRPKAVSPPENKPLLVEEDLVENDWSFLEELDTRNAERIIAAGALKEGSRVLISMASEGFVDRVMQTTSNEVVVAHKSLFVLACVKEKHDAVKCWQGKLTQVPAKWAPLDAVFLYFLPALEDDLRAVLGALSNICSAGARVVVSHPQGRAALKRQRSLFQGVIMADLPEANTLLTVAGTHHFTVEEFTDDDGIFLAVLTFSGIVK